MLVRYFLALVNPTLFHTVTIANRQHTPQSLATVGKRYFLIHTFYKHTHTYTVVREFFKKFVFCVRV